MRMEIAIIGTEFLRDFIEKAMARLNLDLDYTLYTYSRFEDLPAIFEAIPDKIRGVVTSGSFPARILQKSFPGSPRVIRPFNNDDAGLYKLFLQILSRNRSLDVSRIYIDMLEAAGLGLEEYLFGEREISYSEVIVDFLAQKPLEELVAMENYYADKHLELWRQGKTDLSVTRFSSIVHRLREAGLKVLFAYPSVNYLGAICQETAQAVRIAEMQGNQVAAIRVTARIPEGDPEQEERLEQLKQALKRFSTVQQLDFLIRRAPQGFEILTNRRMIIQSTEKLSSCLLQDFVKQRLNFDVQVGYGIGENMYQARINAVDANREAARLPFSASCLINERDELIGPLKSGRKLVVSREVSLPVKNAARRSGLSYLTIQKVMAAVDSTRDGQLTARELAHKLSITTRSANRFLSALSEAGLARAVEVRRGTTKGRPERVYQVTFVGAFKN